jgi:hypothetical protein
VAKMPVFIRGLIVRIAVQNVQEIGQLGRKWTAKAQRRHWNTNAAVGQKKRLKLP